MKIGILYEHQIKMPEHHLFYYRQFFECFIKNIKTEVDRLSYRPFNIRTGLLNVSRFLALYFQFTIGLWVPSKSLLQLSTPNSCPLMD